VTVKILEKLRWLGHDSFLYEGPPAIYFDPWKLPKQNLPKADIVLVSHEHGDHCSPPDVRKVSDSHTVIVASQTAAPKLQGDVRVLRPGDTLVVGQVTVEAVPAYNTTKFRSPGVPFHPKSDLHNGYVVVISGERIYFAGDTDHIPEMAGLRCDIALLPVSGTYVMTAQEAAEAARVIAPQVAVPMHYGAGVVGTRSDAELFRDLYGGPVFLYE
jgi:L-ascorbate metabolism protein UlaG (beta-lactamase superfamily)